MNKIEPFPGRIERKWLRARITLDTEQTEWLKRNYPVNCDRRIAEAMGISKSFAGALGRRMGLRKIGNAVSANISESLKKGWARKIRLHEAMGKPCKYTGIQYYVRKKARQRMYIVPPVFRGVYTKDRWTVYYDSDTQRSERFEETCRLNGFQIQPFDNPDSERTTPVISGENREWTISV